MMSADPPVKNVMMVKSVSGGDLNKFPPIVPPAGNVGADAKSNGQVSLNLTNCRGDIQSLCSSPGERPLGPTVKVGKP